MRGLLPIFLGVACLVILLTLVLYPVDSSPPPNPHRPMKVLVVGDPFANPLVRFCQDLEATWPRGITVETVGYNDTRLLTLQNQKDLTSSLHLVSFDVVWMGEYAQQGVLYPLTDYLASTPDLQVDDYLRSGIAASSHNGVLYGLPIQPHPELLWYRQDLFAKQGIQPPTTTAELLAILPQLHQPEQGIYGICWNGQMGQALGQTVAHFYAAFGGHLLDGEGRPSLNSAEGLAAAKFALALLPYSPPDILRMAWDERTRRFASGQAAMTYGWAARAYLAEDDPASVVKGKVGYLGAPVAPGQTPVTPMGAWSLGIPANLSPDERDAAWRLLAQICGVEGQRRLADLGNGGMPRQSLLTDPVLQKRYPAFATVARLSQENALQDAMRPRIPQWPPLAEILGTVFHEMLQGKRSPEDACQEAQRQAERLFTPTPPSRGVNETL